MTTPAWPNPLGASDINVELGRPSNQRLELNDPVVRALAQVAGDRVNISMWSLRDRSVAMTLTGSSDRASGTVYGGTSTTFSCYPSVAVKGGSGTYTYEWSFVRGSYSMTGANTNRPRVYSSFKYAYNGDAELQVKVTDSTSGKTATIRGIYATFEIYQDGQQPI